MGRLLPQGWLSAGREAILCGAPRSPPNGPFAHGSVHRRPAFKPWGQMADRAGSVLDDRGAAHDARRQAVGLHWKVGGLVTALVEKGVPSQPIPGQGFT